MAVIAISHVLNYKVRLSIILVDIMCYAYPYVLCTMGDRLDRAIHMKEFDGWCVRTLKPVVDLEVGAEGYPLLVEVVGTRVRNVTPSDRCPHSAEIRDEVTLLGGRQVFQEEGNCWGLYLREKKERKDVFVR